MRQLLVIFGLIQFLLMGQNYQAFDTNMTWHTTRGSSYYSSTCGERDDFYDYYTKGYEINNGNYWHKVYVRIYEGYYYYNALTPNCPPISAVVTNSFVGWFSNDTIHKKVYFVQAGNLTPNFAPTSTNLIFDFNKNVNDTFKVGNLPYKITSIDSFLFDNKYHKYYKGSTTFPNNYPPNQAFYIEGVGSSIGVFNSSYNVTEGSSTPLFCFSNRSKSKQLVGAGRLYLYPSSFADSDACISLPTSIGKYNKVESAIKLYPVPCHAYLNINLSAEDIMKREMGFKLLNNLGQEFTTKIESHEANTAQLNTSDLPPGIYFLRISAGKSNIETIKFIRQ